MVDYSKYSVLKKKKERFPSNYLSRFIICVCIYLRNKRHSDRDRQTQLLNSCQSKTCANIWEHWGHAQSELENRSQKQEFNLRLYKGIRDPHFLSYHLVKFPRVLLARSYNQKWSLDLNSDSEVRDAGVPNDELITRSNDYPCIYLWIERCLTNITRLTEKKRKMETE